MRETRLARQECVAGATAQPNIGEALAYWSFGATSCGESSFGAWVWLSGPRQITRNVANSGQWQSGAWGHRPSRVKEALTVFLTSLASVPTLGQFSGGF